MHQMFKRLIDFDLVGKYQKQSQSIDNLDIDFLKFRIKKLMFTVFLRSILMLTEINLNSKLFS